MLNWNDLEGSDYDVIKVPSWHLPGGPEEDSFRITGVVADIPNGNFPSTILRCGQNAKLAGQLWLDGRKASYHVFLSAKS
jgi:hypothetical protein